MDKKTQTSFISWFVLLLSLLLFSGKSLSLWQESSSLGIEWGYIPAVFGISALSCIIILKLPPSPGPFLALLGCVFFSDWITRPYNFIQGPMIRGEILIFSALTYLLLKGTAGGYFRYLPFLGIVLCVASFISRSQGRLIFSDDHTVFLFRLQLLKDNFPGIPFFYPFWNAGMDARDFFATGALNVFAIFSPLIYLFNVTEIYNLIVLLILFGIYPVSFYAAARLMKLETPAPSIAAALSICMSLSWYRWALQYGTLGFLISLALLPLNLALICRLISKDEQPSYKLVFLFTATFTLMLFWSLSGFFLLPCLFYAAWNVRRLITNKKLLVCAALLLMLNLPWIFTFWNVSNVSKFLTTPAEHQFNNGEISPTSVDSKQSINLSAIKLSEFPQILISDSKIRAIYLQKAVRKLREGFLSMNPLLFTLGIFGLLALAGLRRSLLSATCIWLLIMAVAISPLKPKLELERMFLALSAVLSLTTAHAFERLLAAAREQSAFAWRASLSLAGGFLLVSQFSAATAVLNRTPAQYFFADSEVAEISQLLANKVTTGRAAFTGFVLHELSNGHLAPLTIWSKVPLMASSQFHNAWTYKQLIPKQFFERGEPGIESYFDLYNVSHVFAHEKDWLSYFNSRDGIYKKVWKGKQLSMFRRINHKDTYFIEGEGEILDQTGNSVIFQLKTPGAVLSFTYFPFMQAEGCSIGMRDYGKDTKLIELNNCPVNQKITLKSVGLLKRLGA